MFGTYKKNDGFVVAFDNGWAVSVRFGLRSFSSTQFEEHCDEETRMCTSPDAELAMMFQGRIVGDVIASVSTEGYAAICGQLAQVPSFSDPREVLEKIEVLSRSRAGWKTAPVRNP